MKNLENQNYLKILTTFSSQITNFEFRIAKYNLQSILDYLFQSHVPLSSLPTLSHTHSLLRKFSSEINVTWVCQKLWVFLSSLDSFLQLEFLNFHNVPNRTSENSTSSFLPPFHVIRLFAVSLLSIRIFMNVISRNI